MSAITAFIRGLENTTFIQRFISLLGLLTLAASVFYFIAVPNSLKVR